MGDGADPPLWKRLAWFFGLWAAGVLTVIVIGYALRWVIPG